MILLCVLHLYLPAVNVYHLPRCNTMICYQINPRIASVNTHLPRQTADDPTVCGVPTSKHSLTHSTINTPTHTQPPNCSSCAIVTFSTPFPKGVDPLFGIFDLNRRAPPGECFALGVQMLQDGSVKWWLNLNLYGINEFVFVKIHIST